MYCALKVPYGPHARNHYDLFIPEGSEESALTICLHGGWWSQGRNEDLRLLCLALAESRIASATIDFRSFADGARAGQDLIDEIRGAIVKILDDSAVNGMDGRSLILLGSGSGSLLALTLAAQLGEDPKLRVRGAIACGVTPSLDHGDGMAGTLAKAIDQFAGTQRHALSPLHIRPEAFPPLLLLHGDADAEVPAKLAHRFHLKVVEGGEESALAVLSGLGHQFVENPMDRGGKAALERIVPFIQEHARAPEAEASFCDPGHRGAAESSQP